MTPLKIKFQNILKIDKKISEDFFNKFSINDVFKKERIQENETYLDNTYKFIGETNVLTNWNIMLELFCKWRTTLEASKFHKAHEFKDAFINCNIINSALSEHFKVDYDLYFAKILQTIFVTFSLSQLRKDNQDYFLKSDEDFIDHLEDGSEETAKGYYSRGSVCELIEREVSSWLTIVSNTYNIPMNVVNFNYIISHFILFLESEKFLSVETKKLSTNEQMVHVVKYSVQFDPFEKLNLSFPYFYLDINKYQPILLINSELTTSQIYCGALFQVPDYIFKSKKVIKTNSAYGWLSETYKETDFLKETVHNIARKTQEPKFSTKKQQVVMDFRDKKLHILLTIIKKENKVRAFTNTFKFDLAIDEFIKTHLSGLNVVLEASNDELFKLINLHANLNNNKNKTLLNDLLIFAKLKLFAKTFANEKPHYYPFEYDFRGRKYYNSQISFTNFKLSRFYEFYGYYSNNELKTLINSSLKTKAVQVIEPLFDKLQFLEKIAHESYFKGDEKELKFRKCLLIHFTMSIGTLYKSKILNDPKKRLNGFSFNNEALFNQGLEELQVYLKTPINPSTELDYEDRFKFLAFFDYISKGVNLLKKEMICLDFSCSGHQLRYLFSGFIDDDSYKHININGRDQVTDVYSCIIVLFKSYLSDFYKNQSHTEIFENKTKPSQDYKYDSYHDELNTLFKKIEDIDRFTTRFVRKYLKKSLMTGEYNATFPTFADYYQKNFNDFSENFEYDRYDQKENERFTSVLKALFRFSKNLALTNEFKSKSNQQFIVDQVKAGGYKTTSWDNFLINYAVFDKIKCDKRVYLNTYKNGKLVRHTQKLNVFSDQIRKSRTERSIMPNFIHGIDGSIVRLIVFYNKDAYYTVHDAYLIPFQEVFQFKDLMNDVIKLDYFWQSPETRKISRQSLLKRHPLSSKRLKMFYFHNINLRSRKISRQSLLKRHSLSSKRLKFFYSYNVIL